MPAKFLDVRSADQFDERPTAHADNIPLEILKASAYRLPAKRVPISVADTGPESSAALEVFKSLGYSAHLAEATFEAPGPIKYRIWSVPEFLLEHILAHPPGRALCLACGAGREAVVLVAAGWEVVALDRLPDALERGSHLERLYRPSGTPSIDWRLGDLRGQLAADLTCFDLVTQLRFWHPLTKAHVTQALVSGGSGLFELLSSAHYSPHRRGAELFSLDDWSDWSPVEHVDEGSRKVVVRSPT